MTILRGPILRRLAVAGCACLVLGLAAAFWTSGRIASVFEARERDSATRLLGRAYPLAEGVLGSAEDLAHRLDRLGYRRARGGAGEPGTYAAWRGVVEAHLRPFSDADGLHPAQRVLVEFEEGRIVRVDPGPALLEPETIAVLQGPQIEERDPVDLGRCPRHLIDAVLAAEDRRFFIHPGIDPGGVARAIWTNVSSGSLSQGGSTLTQQLAKNLYFSGERTFTRKASEAFAAVVLEARFTKERILRAYLNEIYLGQRGPASIRGVARASRHYFGKDVSDLTLAESALLAGMIRAPGAYNPFLRPERARERRDLVLRAMEETGSITAEQRRQAEREPVRVRRPGAATASARAPYVADLVRQNLETRYGWDLPHLGLRVHTSIDPIYQEEAETAVARGLRDLERDYRSLKRRGDGRLQACLVALDLRDGAILAMVGGRDFGSSQFNRVTSARRQPGSLFKPVVYLAGVTHPGDPDRGGREIAREPEREDETGLTDDPSMREPRRRRWWWWRRHEEVEEPDEAEDEDVEFAPPRMPLTAATILMDEPYEVLAGGKLWSPRNDDDTFRGPVSVQQAIEESLNVPTARAAAAIGLGRVAATGRSLGIASPLPEVPSLALGTPEVTPLEMAAAFSTIASGGRRVKPELVLAVEEPGNGVRPAAARRASGSAAGGAGERAVSEAAAYLMTALLQGVLDHGTGGRARALGFNGVAAGKTGTSDGGRDLWFCGYTPSVLALVWVGFDDGAATGLSGSRAALPIWVEFMEKVGADASWPFEGDETLTWEEIDPATGGLARGSCPDSRLAPFVPGTEPFEKCRRHRGFWARWLF